MALIGLLVVGAAAASILGRVDMSARRPELASPVVRGPGREPGRQDRQTGGRRTCAGGAPPPAVAPVSEPLRLAFASTTADIDRAEHRYATADVSGAAGAVQAEACRQAAPQKSYALLSDAQIAGIKERLKLSSSQEPYWPAVESALRAVARKIHETRQADPHATGAPIDPESAEVQQLKSAAMPLLFQLREDQKNEVRTLARLIGLEQVASQI